MRLANVKAIRLVTALSLLLTAFTAPLVFADLKMIYGADSREDFIPIGLAEQHIARAVFTFVPESNLTRVGSDFSLRAPRLRDTGWCPKERFAEQPTAGLCTGFLVAPDVVITASHCVLNRDDGRKVGELRAVFDFAVDSAGQSPHQYTKNQVYAMEEPPIAVRTDTDNGVDWVALRLDRKAVNRTPLKLPSNDSSQLRVGDELIAYGYPLGLPAKRVKGRIVHAPSDFAFKTDLDVFIGNSGSPVFLASDIAAGQPQVIGIVVNGNVDHGVDAANNCRTSYVCTIAGQKTRCSGETATRGSVINFAAPEQQKAPVAGLTIPVDAIRRQLGLSP